MDEPLRILHLEDEPDYVTFVRDLFESHNLNAELVLAKNLAEFHAALKKTRFDLILADYHLPTCTGLEALEITKRECPDTPFLLLSGTLGEQAAIESIKKGATDYVLKQWPDKLVPAVRRAVNESREHTHRQQAEARLHLQITALESAANAIVITDRDGKIIWTNPAFSQFTGYSAEEVLGQNPRLLKSGRQDQTFYQNLWNTILAGRCWHSEMVNRRKDGSLYTEDATITPVRDDSGQITHFIAIKQDISARKQAEESLFESQRQFSVFMQHLPAAVFIKDDLGRLIFANQYLTDLFGWHDWHGKSTSDLVPPEHAQRMEENDRSALARGLLVAQEAIADTTGRLHTFETYKFPVSVPGKPALLGGIAVDVTEQRNLENHLRQAQKMEAIGQLAGGVAHDFNNLLLVIRGNAEILLLDDTRFSQRDRESLNHIIAASERAAKLTRQLLAFSRKQVMQSQRLKLNDIIADLTKMLNRVIGEHIHLRCEYGPNLPAIQADVSMIEQVLVNLVVNARDAMPHGGHLVITTSNISIDAAAANGHTESRPGDFVILSVRDSGTGIAPELLPRIFEPFFTTKQPGQGTGLGLATVYGIVKQHQGWVDVVSQPGTGTTFKIFLPAFPPAPAQPAQTASQPPTRGGTERILLVEDDLSIRLLTRKILETSGYSVAEAATGREALDLWKASNGAFDLLFTDIVMPDGINGRELAEMLRADRPDLKVVFATGYSPDVAGKDTSFFRKEDNHFLQKPYPPNQLLRTVREALDNK